MKATTSTTTTSSTTSQESITTTEEERPSTQEEKTMLSHKIDEQAILNGDFSSWNVEKWTWPEFTFDKNGLVNSGNIEK